MASCVCGEHDFYVKITQMQKSGNAVARASVATVRLHRLIRHKGINTRRIIACKGGSGGGESSFGRGASKSTTQGGIFDLIMYITFDCAEIAAF
jgi:hypothetical protein